MKNKMVMLASLFAIILIAALIVVNIIAVRYTTDYAQGAEYKYHYVLITDKANQSFWEAVEKGARKYGKENDAFVEVMGRGIAVNYSQKELLDIAIESKVDGIILEGMADEEQIALINQARDEDIPVITMVNDSYGSRRLSFIGIGNYNLGREYAREIIKLCTKDTKKIAILMDNLIDDTNTNLLLNGFSETIANEGNHLEFETEVIKIDSMDNFSSQQKIRDLFMRDENIPDVLVCVNENATLNTYQAVVDYNLVGKVNIVGYCASDAVLTAINKGVISSTIALDAKEMGTTAVSALNEYHELGHVSEYLTSEAKVINKSNIMEYFENDSRD